MSGDGVFVDEAHFIRRRCIENGPLAMLGQDACILLASTPPTGPSGIQSILDGELNGQEICTKVNFEFTCRACKIRQKEHPEIMCIHRMHLRPHVQNMHAILVARAAYGEASDSFQREHQGVTTADSDLFIDPAHIEELRLAPPILPTKSPKYVYVSCDPNGSSRHWVDDHTSAYAFVTCYFQGLQTVVSVRQNYSLLKGAGPP